MKLTPLGANINEVDLGVYRVLFSYKTPVAYEKDGKCYHTKQWYSKTTSRHINKWLEYRSSEIVEQSEIDDLCDKGGLQCKP